ncbi:TPA: hypothetical protein DEP21_03010 [Patescibacteria group bacterium]|nr:hypothetical protein [Candidatus Gracilibacteria bacterium]
MDELDKVLEYDKTHPIKYKMGERTSLENGLDCSGLIIYTMHQAGLEAPGAESRAMFSNLDTEKLEMDDDGDITNLNTIKAGDTLFWNTTNPDYDWKDVK